MYQSQLGLLVDVVDFRRIFRHVVAYQIRTTRSEYQASLFLPFANFSSPNLNHSHLKTNENRASTKTDQRICLSRVLG